MKMNIKTYFGLALVILTGAIGALPVEAKLLPIVQDGFEAYTNGPALGQGGWYEYVNGANFLVQDSIVYKNKKALYNNSSADSVIQKVGTPLSNGKQVVYIKTQNRSGWGPYPNGNVQVRLLKGSWGGAELRNFVAISFKSDGNVAYYDAANDAYKNFATYNDAKWTRLTIEWRSSDKTARYRINGMRWTDWYPIAGSNLFTDFDNIGFDTIALAAGGAYFDDLR